MTYVEITFLGTTAAIPTSTRNHPAIYLRYIGKEEHCMLFDCGEGTQRQIFKAGLNFMRIENIFITHWHADHFAGLLGILETMSLEKRKKPLTIFGPEAEKNVKLLLNVGYGYKNFEIIAKDTPEKRSIIFSNKEYEISSFPVVHGIPSVGYSFVEKDRIKIDKNKIKELGLPEKSKMYERLKKEKEIEYNGKTIKLEDVSYIEKGKKVVYSGDTKLCKSLISESKDANIVILDCTYFENNSEKIEGRYHMSLDDVIELMKYTNAKIVLTHISRRYQSYEELEKIIKEKIENNEIIIAKDFSKIRI
jgi:ribonuclease Z